MIHGERKIDKWPEATNANFSFIKLVLVLVPPGLLTMTAGHFRGRKVELM